MSNALLRPLSISQHPLHDRRYRLPTPPIEALYTLIIDALHRRRPGVMVYGRSRLGKTTAIAYIEALLAVDRPALPVVTLRCRFKRVPSETAFFSNFLAAVRHKATTGARRRTNAPAADSPDVRVGRCQERLADLAVCRRGAELQQLRVRVAARRSR